MIGHGMHDHFYSMVFAGNPTKIVIDGGVDPFLDVIAREGLGHHWMIAYGDVRQELRDFCEATGVRHIPATP